MPKISKLPLHFLKLFRENYWLLFSGHSVKGNISDLKILSGVNGHHTRPTFKDENTKVGKQWTAKGRSV